jgi:protein gp37
MQEIKIYKRKQRNCISIYPGSSYGLSTIDIDGIDWVIVGGESGIGARPIESEWVRNVRDECRSQNVAFFFKQWGGVNKKKNGRSLDGRTWDTMPPQALAFR